MKLCKKCFREFDEDESIDSSPARELGDIFILKIGNDDLEKELCPECREEFGVMNLIGFMH